MYVLDLAGPQPPKDTGQSERAYNAALGSVTVPEETLNVLSNEKNRVLSLLRAATLAVSLSAGASYAASVAPTIIGQSQWQSGNAAAEAYYADNCGDFAYKVDDWDRAGKDGQYSHAGNVITISNSHGGQSFNWTSDYPVCAVIVKGGPGAGVYRYNPAVTSDYDLTAPVNPKNNRNYGVSHVTFVFSDPQKCYQQESAWSAGPRYNTQGTGNWATYTPYTAGLSANLLAGQIHLAGTATFSAPVGGMVTITIALNDGFIFSYDPLNPQNRNVKVQDYAEAPSGNPASGQFAHQSAAAVADRTTTITVPANAFYGIHLDVGREVECVVDDGDVR